MTRLGLLAALFCAGCGAHYPDTPVADSGPAVDAGPVVCVPGLTPHFSDINSRVFLVSCGTKTTACHSDTGGVSSGGLVLASEAYRNLLGDGGGALAQNLAGNVRPILRVKPGDPGNSLLVIKLGLMTSTDPDYGSGMPFDTPGSVCPETLGAIADWIDAGAPND